MSSHSFRIHCICTSFILHIICSGFNNSELTVVITQKLIQYSLYRQACTFNLKNMWTLHLFLLRISPPGRLLQCIVPYLWPPKTAGNVPPAIVCRRLPTWAHPFGGSISHMAQIPHKQQSLHFPCVVTIAQNWSIPPYRMSPSAGVFGKGLSYPTPHEEHRRILGEQLFCWTPRLCVLRAHTKMGTTWWCWGATTKCANVSLLCVYVCACSRVCNTSSARGLGCRLT